MSGKRGEGLTDEKMRKIAAGATAAGVLLILFLVVILIVQFVQIGIINKRKAEYDAAIEQYEELLKNGEVTLETLQAEETLRELAIQNGWTFPR
ncbi:MAG TPA: hypothetical protein H9670_01750 [Firmicutes bacterium]|nr:hypothetical protein [Bacillota bacterium]